MKSALKIQFINSLIAVGLIIAAVLIRWLLDPVLEQSLYLVTLYGAVAVSAWYIGAYPSIFVTLVGYAACNYLFMPPKGMFHLETTNIVGFVAYVFTCAIIIGLGNASRLASKRIEKKEIQRQKAEKDLSASERSTKNILDSISDAFISIDQDWQITYLNHAAEKILGRSAQELLTKNLWDEYPEAVGSSIEDLYRRVISDQSAASITAFYDAHQRWYEIRAYPAKTGLSVYLRDITREKLVDAELRASEKRRQLALDSAELGAWNYDVRTGVLSTDERFNVIFTGEATPKTYEQFLSHIHLEDRARVIDGMEAAANPAILHPYVSEYQVVHNDGSIHWVYAKGGLNFDENKEVISLDGTISDISERKRIEKHLAQQSAELSEIDRRKNQFLATLAHELRNPLSPITNSLSIMKLKSYSLETVERSSIVIERQVGQLVRLVNDLLDVSRISHGKLDLKLERIELGSVVNLAVESSKPMLDKAGVDITLSIPSEKIYLNADLTRLSQVFLNILNNAAKFTDSGGHVHLIVEKAKTTAFGVPENVQVMIKDTGVGITATSLPLVFDAFTQLPDTLNRSHGGLGVGLMLVKTIVNMHGGIVKVHSEGLGLGFTFTVQLPTITLDDTDIEAITSDTSNETEFGMRILIVDDNQDAANSLSTLLEMMGNETHVVHNGLDALNAVSSFNPKVVFLDIGLPDISGYEVASKIRQLPLGKSVVLYALTGWGQVEDQAKSKLAGFNKHIVKPLDPSLLPSLLDKV